MEKLNGSSFSDALILIKQGKKVARKNWNGKNMFIFLVPGSTFQVNRPPLLGIYSEGTVINIPWFCSQTDMLSDDWIVIE